MEKFTKQKTYSTSALEDLKNMDPFHDVSNNESSVQTMQLEMQLSIDNPVGVQSFVYESTTL